MAVKQSSPKVKGLKQPFYFGQKFRKGSNRQFVSDPCGLTWDRGGGIYFQDGFLFSMSGALAGMTGKQGTAAALSLHVVSSLFT